MKTSKTRLKETLNHVKPDKLVVDFSATPVTGIHILSISKLREVFGLENKPIKVIEPYQMLGEIDDELTDYLKQDTIGIGGDKDMFGIPNKDCNWKLFKTPWGQDVLVPEGFNTSRDGTGNTYIYPEGDTSIPPSAKMPDASFFFDAIVRQKPIDENKLNPEDNLEEFALWDNSTIEYWKNAIQKAPDDKGLVVNPGGTAIGDIALVPGVQLKNPRGIRDIAEWYMSTMMRTDYLHDVFTRQTDIAVKNLEILKDISGDKIDVLFICGTDFGTQESTFISDEQYKDLYMPYYQKINNWIHNHTSWKTFKHSCGAIEPFIKLFIESGFDILNPVQINAKGMDPAKLKDLYGNDIVFWGGGIDTQETLSFASPERVKEEVKRNCEILSQNGGYVFNTVHNVMANVPARNLEAMFEALAEINS